jgi:hypothetical protein
VSLSDEDVTFLDTYTTEKGLPSRSTAIHKAIQLLRSMHLGDAYESAWDEWSNEDQQIWDLIAADGLQ